MLTTVSEALTTELQRPTGHGKIIIAVRGRDIGSKEGIGKEVGGAEM